jgi:hypothetical protein
MTIKKPASVMRRFSHCQGENIVRRSTKMKVLVPLVFLLCCLGLTACSFLVKSQHWSPETKDTKWVSSDVCVHYRGYSNVKSAKFEYKDVTISVCPRFKGGPALAVGPPGLPIIPNPGALFGGDDERFTILLTIDSRNHMTGVDLSNIRVKFSEQTILPVLSAEVLGIGGKKESATINKVFAGKEIAKYDLTFDISKNQVGEIVIDLGTVEVDEESIILPPLIYKNDPTVDYFPFVFGS